MASRVSRAWPLATRSPTETETVTTLPGMGERIWPSPTASSRLRRGGRAESTKVSPASNSTTWWSSVISTSASRSPSGSGASIGWPSRNRRRWVCGAAFIRKPVSSLQGEGSASASSASMAAAATVKRSSEGTAVAAS